MKQRFVTFMLLLCAPSFAEQLPSGWQNWQYFAPVNLEQIDAPRLAGVVVPAHVYTRVQSGLADLRVIDARDQEVPYVLHTRPRKHAVEWRDARMLEVSFAPEKDTQAIVDTGTEGPVHNSLLIETSETDYFVWVEVGVSRDSRNWRILHERAPIYRFAKERLDGNRTINYPPSNSRYLRVRILEGTRKFALTGCRVANEVKEEAELTEIDARLAPDPATPAQQTWWLADLGPAHQPISEVRFEVEQVEFHRAARVATSDDGKRWVTAVDAAIYRWTRKSSLSDALEPQQRERLHIAFPEMQARFLRVEVVNRNDPPLAGARLTLYGTPRRVIFRQEPGQSYRLIYGHKRIKPASYEMSWLTDVEALNAAHSASVGAEVVNGGYVDPNPWSERHPHVLWGALGIAVIVLGLLAVRALKSQA